MGFNITYKELFKILLKNGWEESGYRRHGYALCKEIDNKTRVTLLKKTNKTIPTGTLMKILGPDQTGLGKKWLEDQLKKKKRR